jgi:ADP-heptose:LPS heptosyltransferase
MLTDETTGPSGFPAEVNAGGESGYLPIFTRGNFRRVLVMRLDNMGDVVMLGPALRTLREALPAAKITLMTSPAGGQVAPLLPWLDDVIVTRASWQAPAGMFPFEPGRDLALIEELHRRQFDAALIFTNPPQSTIPAAYAAYLAGIPHRIGFANEFGGAALSFSPAPPSDQIHQVDRNLALLEAIHLPISGIHLELRIPFDVQASADRLLKKVGIKPGTPFIVLAPGSTDTARRYDPERFAEVVRILSIESDCPIVIVGNSREAQTLEPVIRMAEEHTHGRAKSLVGLTTVPELAALIRRASLTITNHSAVLQIADALECPAVVLYAGTDLINQWLPRQIPARLLCRPVFCAPCHHSECPYGKECLDIRPIEVVNAALGMLLETVQSLVPAGV